MVFFNYTTMQVSAKIVYYGPGLCGKTTNLQHIHSWTDPSSRGEMVSLETEADRTLFFDLLPLEVGTIGGMRVRVQLYTVPGQVFYNTTRKLVLKGVDGIVFVADSQEPALDANLESFQNLERNLAELNHPIDNIPFVFQYNKRDLRNILSVETLNRHLNRGGFDVYEGAALHGVGVFETLKAISKKTLAAVHRKISGERPSREVTVSRPPERRERPQPVAVALARTSAPSRERLADVEPRGAASVAREIRPAGSIRPTEADTGEASLGRDDNRRAPGTSAESRLGENELPSLREATPGNRSGETPSARPPLVVEGRAKAYVPRDLMRSASSVFADLKLVGLGSSHTIETVAKLELPWRANGEPVRLKLEIELTEDTDR
ncbi:MAG TPA: GTPase domain-containing protein [Vicinamibacteria bacterium]|nr:GTPase domain-containing protein [Vicinamibacteria bacterium]